MFNSLFWMFKQEGFGRHFKYLFSIYLIFISCTVLFIVGSKFINNPLLAIILSIVALILLICPFFCFQGYFWSLTENIINRQVDITSSSIYNGKIKEIYKIELPEINTCRFIWRGIASIVATFLLLYPFIILLIISLMSSEVTLSFYNLDPGTSIILYVTLFGFVGLFIPALLWNYARRDSIFAVWNISKAIHIMGTYFGKYLWNTILFLVFIFINFCISEGLRFILDINNIVLDLSTSPSIIIKAFLFLVIEYAISIYWIFVNAYLLGTIAPPCEG